MDGNYLLWVEIAIFGIEFVTSDSYTFWQYVLDIGTDIKYRHVNMHSSVHPQSLIGARTNFINLLQILKNAQQKLSWLLSRLNK